MAVCWVWLQNTHSYLPVLDFIILVTINNSEHKADLFIRYVGIKKIYKTVVRLLLVFFIDFFFFNFHSKIERKVQKFPIYLLPSHMCSPPPSRHLPPEWYIWYNWWTYIVTSKSAEVHSLHYIVYSWCCKFSGFRQTYNDMYPLLWYHTEYFCCPTSLLCSAFSSPPSTTSPWPPTPRSLASTDLFTVSVVLPQVIFWLVIRDSLCVYLKISKSLKTLFTRLGVAVWQKHVTELVYGLRLMLCGF